MEIKIAILDDEELHRDNIRKIVEEYENITIDEYSKSSQLLESDEDYDILLVDMELQTKDEGIKTVMSYREQGREALVIFVTSHDELSRDGYKVNAFRYVYKPELDKELREALQGAIRYVEENVLLQVSILGETKAEIRVKDIVYFETFGRNVKMHLRHNEYVISEKISELYRRLYDKGFVISHKSYLVNLDRIAGFTNSKVLLKNGDTIKLSRAYKEDAEEKFWNWKLRNDI